MNSLISIIMNCRNGEEYLQESIDSILKQSYKNWELIFVDNASSDKSKILFNEYNDERLKYVFITESVNLGSARQIALENCNGEYISFLDTDDLWLPTKLEKQMENFEDQDIGMVISNTIFFSKNKSKKFYSIAPPTGYVFNQLLENYFISLETLICKKKFLEKISFKFNREYSMISDMDLSLRLSMISKLAYCPLELAKWRVHQSSDSWKKKKLFFFEQLNLIEDLSQIKENKTNKTFIKLKKIFIKKTNFSIILNLLENGSKRRFMFKELFKKELRYNKFCILLILIFLPFNKFIIKLYRSIFSIHP